MDTRAVRLSPLRPLFALALAFSVALASLGCGGAPPAAAPAKLTEPAPRTIDEAEAAIARARSEIERSTSPGGPRPVEAPSEPASAPPRPAPPSDSRASTDDAAHCSTPCRALASMRRAVESLCELAGASDARCVDAKKTLQESETRVGACVCR